MTDGERIAVVETKLSQHENLFNQQSQILQEISSQLTEVQKSITENSTNISNVVETLREDKKTNSLLPNIIITAVVAVLISSAFGMTKVKNAEAQQKITVAIPLDKP